MAYDEDLADRVRALIGGEHVVREQRMFGGLSFLIGGNMALAVSGRGGLLVRASPDDAEDLIGSGQAEVAIMGSRRMRGWVWVPPEQVGDDRELAAWVRRGVAYSTSLPAKRR